MNGFDSVVNGFIFIVNDFFSIVNGFFFVVYDIICAVIGFIFIVNDFFCAVNDYHFDVDCLIYDADGYRRCLIDFSYNFFINIIYIFNLIFYMTYSGFS